MPPHIFAALILTVLAAAAATVAVFAWAGWPAAVVLPATLVASLALRRRKR